MTDYSILKYKIFKFSFIIFALFLIVLFVSSCDSTLLDVFTQVNSNYSGTRTVDLAVKTQYLKKGEVILSGNETLYDKILASLPNGKTETFEKEDYTHFKSTIDFNDINFLQHVSIDNYSDVPPQRFYAKMESDDFFFYSDFFLYDYIDMKVDDSIVESQGITGDLSRINDLFNSDQELLKITYQIKFPVKIIKSNADLIADGNIAIWNLKFGDQEDIFIQGKRIKYLSYVLLVALGLIGLFIIFLFFILIYSRRRKRVTKTKKGHYSYDNYFKKDKYFTSLENRDE